jgi:hypothetical protein
LLATLESTPYQQPKCECILYAEWGADRRRSDSRGIGSSHRTGTSASIQPNLTRGAPCSRCSAAADCMYLVDLVCSKIQSAFHLTPLGSSLLSESSSSIKTLTQASACHQHRLRTFWPDSSLPGLGRPSARRPRYPGDSRDADALFPLPSSFESSPIANPASNERSISMHNDGPSINAYSLGYPAGLAI